MLQDFQGPIYHIAQPDEAAILEYMSAFQSLWLEYSSTYHTPPQSHHRMRIGSFQRPVSAPLH